MGLAIAFLSDSHGWRFELVVPVQHQRCSRFVSVETFAVRPTRSRRRKTRPGKVDPTALFVRSSRDAADDALATASRSSASRSLPHRQALDDSNGYGQCWSSTASGTRQKGNGSALNSDEEQTDGMDFGGGELSCVEILVRVFAADLMVHCSFEPQERERQVATSTIALGGSSDA